MYDRHISTKYFYNISKNIKYLFVLKNISESRNCNVAMKYRKYSWHFSAIFCALRKMFGWINQILVDSNFDIHQPTKFWLVQP